MRKTLRNKKNPKLPEGPGMKPLVNPVKVGKATPLEPIPIVEYEEPEKKAPVKKVVKKKKKTTEKAEAGEPDAGKEKEAPVIPEISLEEDKTKKKDAPVTIVKEPTPEPKFKKSSLEPGSGAGSRRGSASLLSFTPPGGSKRGSITLVADERGNVTDESGKIKRLRPGEVLEVRQKRKTSTDMRCASLSEIEERIDKPSTPLRKIREEQEGPPSIVDFQENVTAVEGATAYIYVEVEGYPAPDFKFYRGGQEIFEGGRYAVVTDGETNRMYFCIRKAKTTDEDRYKIVAYNKLGEDSVTITLYVSGGSQKSSDSESGPSRPTRRSPRFRKNTDDVVSERESRYGIKQSTFESREEKLLSRSIICSGCNFFTKSKTLLVKHYANEHKKAGPNHADCEILPALSEHSETMDMGLIVIVDKLPSATHAQEASPVATSEEVPSVLIEVETNTGHSTDPVDEHCVVKTSYQTTKHNKDPVVIKLKRFEDLKMPREILQMKETPKLKHFFKCVMANCTFTTDGMGDFEDHLLANHSEEELYYCSFCFMEFQSAGILTIHMMLAHSKRRYQCSACFYRATSEVHVQVHIMYLHSAETAEVYTSSTHLTNPLCPAQNDEENMPILPYCCCTSGCKYRTFDPEEFKNHHYKLHKYISLFTCYLCKAVCLFVADLIKHFRLHRLYMYHCNYCQYGSDVKEQVLVHLIDNHAEQPFRLICRSSKVLEAQGSSEKTGSNNGQGSGNLDHVRKEHGKRVKANSPKEVPPVSIKRIKKGGEKILSIA